MTTAGADATALIIGATGQDGAYLSQLLLRQGVAVHATSRQPDNVPADNWQRLDIASRIARHQVDPADGPAIARLVESVQPDVVYVLAGQSSVGRSFDAPVETISSHVLPLLAVVDAVRVHRSGCRIVLAASGEVFGETSADNPAREGSPFRPLNPYATAKVMAVEAARGFRDVYGLCIHIAYLFNHESPLRPAQFVFGKVRRGIADIIGGRADRISLGNGDIIRDWGWAPDYCAGMANLARLDQPQEVIFATGHSVSLRGAVDALLGQAGLDPLRHVEWSSDSAIRRTEARTMYADPAKARALLDWRGSTAFPELATLLNGAEAA